MSRLLVCACGSLGILNLSNYLVALRSFVADEVHVIFTRSAELFVKPLGLSSFCEKIICDSEPSLDRSPQECAEWAQGVVVLPATAHSLACGAQGLADGFASTATICFEGQIVYFPSMNQSMLLNASVRRNIATIRGDGNIVIDGTVRNSFIASKKEVQTSIALPEPNEVTKILRSIYRPQNK